jgi:hypothetical protein
MKPVHHEMLNVFTIVRTNNNYKVSAASFFKEVSILLPEQTVRCQCKWNDKIEAVVVNSPTESTIT